MPAAYRDTLTKTSCTKPGSIVSICCCWGRKYKQLRVCLREEGVAISSKTLNLFTLLTGLFPTRQRPILVPPNLKLRLSILSPSRYHAKPLLHPTARPLCITNTIATWRAAATIQHPTFNIQLCKRRLAGLARRLFVSSRGHSNLHAGYHQLAIPSIEIPLPSATINIRQSNPQPDHNPSYARPFRVYRH